MKMIPTTRLTPATTTRLLAFGCLSAGIFLLKGVIDAHDQSGDRKSDPVPLQGAAEAAPMLGAAQLSAGPANSYEINWIQVGTVAVPDQSAGQESNPHSPQPGSFVQTSDGQWVESKWVWDYIESGPVTAHSPSIFGRVGSIKKVDDGLSIMMINTGEGQPSWVNVYPATVVQNSAGAKADLAVGQLVRVLYGDILYMTDPGQVDAQSINIKAE